jgi:predicted extracellular nuclease
LVQVTGIVQEVFEQTQIAATSVTVFGTASLPLPVTIIFPIDPVDLEAFEGMRVEVGNTMTITEMFNLDRFNEIKLYAGDRPYQYTQLNEPDVAGLASAHSTQERLREWAIRSVSWQESCTMPSVSGVFTVLWTERMFSHAVTQ